MQLKNKSKIIQWEKVKKCDVVTVEEKKEDTPQSFKPVRSPKFQIFVEMFRRNLQSPITKHHVGAHLRCTNIAAGK